MLTWVVGRGMLDSHMEGIMTCGVYEIVNTVNGKRYVGSSKNIEKREKEHFNDLRRGRHHAIALQRAWNKYGENNFYFSVIEECADVELIEREQAHLDSGFDYNSSPTAGNCLGVKHSDETRAKVSEFMRRRNSDNPDMLDRFRFSHKGKPKTDEWKKRSSEWQRGRKATDTAIINMAIARAVLTDEQVSKVVELKREGYSNAGICKITGFTQKTVQKICSGTGYKWASNQLTPEEIVVLNGRQRKRAV